VQQIETFNNSIRQIRNAALSLPPICTSRESFPIKPGTPGNGGKIIPAWKSEGWWCRSAEKIKPFFYSILHSNSKS
jgi:hypothetical protein